MWFHADPQSREKARRDVCIEKIHEAPEHNKEADIWVGKGEEEWIDIAIVSWSEVSGLRGVGMVSVSEACVEPGGTIYKKEDQCPVRIPSTPKSEGFAMLVINLIQCVDT